MKKLIVFLNLFLFCSISLNAQTDKELIDKVNSLFKEGKYSEAIIPLRKLAEKGNGEAQLNLGKMYATGKGVVQNESEAVNWYRKAAEQGNEDAKDILKYMEEIKKLDGHAKKSEESEEKDIDAEYQLGLDKIASEFSNVQEIRKAYRLYLGDNYQDAIVQCAKIIPSVTTNNQNQYSKVYLVKAMCEEKLKLYFDAINDYTSYLVLGGRDSSCLASRSLCYANTGQFDKAKEDCNTIIQATTRKVNPADESNEFLSFLTIQMENIELMKNKVRDNTISSSAEPDPNNFVAVQKQPEPLNLNEIRIKVGYPSIAKEANIEGTAKLKVLVDENGNYMKHIVINRIHPLLMNEIEKYISEIKFTPAIQQGKPIKFWVTVPFGFKLQ